MDNSTSDTSSGVLSTVGAVLITGITSIAFIPKHVLWRIIHMTQPTTGKLRPTLKDSVNQLGLHRESLKTLHALRDCPGSEKDYGVTSDAITNYLPPEIRDEARGVKLHYVVVGLKELRQKGVVVVSYGTPHTRYAIVGDYLEDSA